MTGSFLAAYVIGGAIGWGWVVITFRGKSSF